MRNNIVKYHFSPAQFDIYETRPALADGHVMQKTRPYLVLSRQDMNRDLETVIIAPITSTQRSYLSRVSCVLKGAESYIALDQVQVADKSRLIRRVATLDESTQVAVLKTWYRMIDPAAC